tara:strand:- start:486 stop:1373 length:888 start_codon:yes stop_codon:yes gene_type:complete
VFDRITNLLDIQLETYKIYRCYYNNELQIWFPKEIRDDKNVANNRYIVKEITNYFKNPWNVGDVTHFLKSTPYYQKKGYKNFRDKNMCDLYSVLKKYCGNKNIFDIGCGFNVRKIRNITKCNYYTGLDMDINIAKTMSKKTAIHLVDMTKCWFQQINKMNDTIYPNMYDGVLLLNSIHFAYNTIDTLISSINKIAKEKSFIIIKFLNKKLLKQIAHSPIVHNSNFVKLISEDQIKYYYPHCHIKPLVEHIFSCEEIIKRFSRYGWNPQKQFDFLYGKESTWDNYMDCFSILVLQR